MIKNLHYQLQLNVEQADFLADTSYGHNRMKYLVSLIKMAALKPYPSLIVGSKETVGVGMVERSIKQLSGDWDLDYKTTGEMLKTMNALGIITTTSTPQTSTHVIHVVAAWVVDTVCILNPHFCRGFDKTSVHIGHFDSTAIADEFNIAMNESITAYMENLPKGGRGKKKSSASKKVILPTIKGLEMYEQMSAKAESHSEESISPTEVSESTPIPTADADGSGTSSTSTAHKESIATENPSGDSSNEILAVVSSSDETEVSHLDPSVSDASETPDEQHTSVSDNASEPHLGAQSESPSRQL